MSSVHFYEPFYDFDRILEEALKRRPGAGHAQQHHKSPAHANNVDGAIRSFKPRMDLHEDAEKNLVTATFDLPGVKKEDVQIDIQNGHLIVSAESKVSTEHNEEGYAVRERHYGKLSRTLQLPKGVKEEEIKASLENGVLSITFPKSAPEEAPRRIAIA
ncbi:small heat shock protein [Cyathus striatus]|nr:small heat shock protein [Cyathus striatus]